MQVFTYTRPNKLDLLHDQLIAAGITPLIVEGRDDDIRLTVSDSTTKASVDAVVNAHDPSVLSAGEQAALDLEADRTELREQAAAAIARLDAIVADGGTYTAAQVRDAMVDLARILRRVLKLLRRM